MTNELNDFGFCFVDDEEFEAPKLELENVKEATTAEIELIKTQAFDTIQSMQSLILPLLLNLKKNPEKTVIKWPNRGPIIQAQIDKIEKLIDDWQSQIL